MPKSLTIPSDEVRDTLDKRRVDEKEPSTRSEAQRDRDRILYASAFLRLAHVTQVAAPEVGHAFHSRLTHSLKVAQVARGLAQRLKTLAARGKLDSASTRLVAALDEDATEAAALAHDLGHPPFGHLAERVLHAEADHATFEGNPQSFRIVTRLALRAIEPPGLNLTRRTLNGLLKYPYLRGEDPGHSDKWGAYGTEEDYFKWVREGMNGEECSLEAMLMDWADDVTYAVHDMDDFFRAGLVPLDRLGSDKQELGDFMEHLARKYPERRDELLPTAEKLFPYLLSVVRTRYVGRIEDRVGLRQLGSTLIGRYIAAVGLSDAGNDKVTYSVSAPERNQVAVLKELTWFYVINRPSLAVIQRGQERIVRALFHMYRDALKDADFRLFPRPFDQFAESAVGEVPKERVVIDLIASLTEASASEIYKQELGVSAGSLLRRAAGPS